MANIQSATAEIRRGKKNIEDRYKKKPQGKNIMAFPITWAAIKRGAYVYLFDQRVLV